MHPALLSLVLLIHNPPDRFNTSFDRAGGEVLPCHSFLSASAYGYQRPILPSKR